MKRRQWVVGNWKMHKTQTEAVQLVHAIFEQLQQHKLYPLPCEVLVAPSYTSLVAVHEQLANTGMGLCAQDIFFEDTGAYTGAIAGGQLLAAGCRHVLIGHSERRSLFGETLSTSRQRITAALRHGLTPILCVGETLEERQQQQTEQVTCGQLEAAIFGLTPNQLKSLIVAYEPVWAIGTGVVATPEQAQEVHRLLRQALARIDAVAADVIPILYGGSVKASNAGLLLAQPDIDGALVGGASLQAVDFVGIIKQCAQLKIPKVST